MGARVVWSFLEFGPARLRVRFLWLQDDMLALAVDVLEVPGDSVGHGGKGKARPGQER